METTPLQRCRTNLAFWQKQAHQLERDRTKLKWIVIVGLPVAAVALWFKVPLGLLGLGTVLGTYILGLYMITVRRGEYAHNVREAEEALRRAEGAA